MTLELSSLQKAVRSLDNAVIIAKKKEKEKSISPEEISLIKAGVIQNFEFTYELCWKFMKRWLENNLSHEAVDGITRKELFRMGAEHKLIDDTSAWFEFHKARNLTSHLYDEEVAELVYVISKKFQPEAQKLLKQFKAKND